MLSYLCASIFIKLMDGWMSLTVHFAQDAGDGCVAAEYFSLLFAYDVDMAHI